MGDRGKKVLFIFWILLSNLFAVGSVDITNIGVGARPIGMGKSFVALADDASAMFLNPAGLGQLTTPYFHNTQTNLLGDIDYFTLGGVIPLDKGNMAASFQQASVGDIPLTTLDSDGRPVKQDETTYRDSLMMVAYGLQINDLYDSIFPHALKGKLYGGATFKYFSKGVPDIAMGRGLDLDLGLLYKTDSDWQFGIYQKNFLTALFNTEMISWSTGARDRLDSYTKLGTTFLINPDWRILTDYDFSVRRGKALMHLGTEYNLQDVVQVRAGWEQLDDSIQATTDGHFSMGFSMNLQGAILDYAYTPYYELENNATHYISIQYKFSDIIVPSIEFLDEKDEDIEILLPDEIISNDQQEQEPNDV